VKTGEGSTVSPAGSAVIVVSGGTVSTVHRAIAGVGSKWAARSLARTRRECGPSTRPAYWDGEAQGLKAAPSRLQEKVVPASSDENARFGARFEVLRLGAESIVVSGAVESSM
jgi:hypothetical protein